MKRSVCVEVSWRRHFVRRPYIKTTFFIHQSEIDVASGDIDLATRVFTSGVKRLTIRVRL